MKLNESIANALKKAIIRWGNRYQLSLKVDIPQQTLKRWAELSTDSINDDAFVKILPYLQPYLPAKEYESYVNIFTVSSFKATVHGSFNKKSEKQNNPEISSEKKEVPLSEDEDFKKSEREAIENERAKRELLISFDTSSFVGVPLLTEAQAATMQPRSIAGDSAPDTGEVCFFDRAKEGDFAVQVSGESMLPWYPAGTKLLIGRNDRLHDGDRVVAMLEGRIDPVFKVYVDLVDRFALLSINREVGNGPMVFDKMDRESVFWVWPIKASIRDERALDVAMKRAGVRHFWETVKEELKQADAK